MRRRGFISLLGGAAAASSASWPHAARAQQAGKLWRIGILDEFSRLLRSETYDGLLQGLRELGYAEGKNFILDFGDADGRLTTLQDKAAELVRQKADMILIGTALGFRAAKSATRTIPILMVGIVDPVGSGYVQSLARPGGNVTGLATSSDDTASKQLELLAEIVPNRSRIAILGNPDAAGYAAVVRIVQGAAQKAGFEIVAKEARNLPEIEAAFAALAKERVQAVMMTPSALFGLHRARIVELALNQRLPTMATESEFVTAGGLMSYGQNRKEYWRQVATYVHTIMRGAKPADLPVQQPTHFHLTINRKTANALGLTIPPVLYIFADEVIE